MSCVCFMSEFTRRHNVKVPKQKPVIGKDNLSVHGHAINVLYWLATHKVVKKYQI